MTTIHAANILGIAAQPVTVEAKRGEPLPSLKILGLGEISAKETRYRVEAALRTIDVSLLHLPTQVLIQPVQSSAPSLDLPIAIAVAAEIGALDTARANLDKVTLFGELSLGGEVRGTRGALQIAEASLRAGRPTVICSTENAREAAISGATVIAVRSLGEAFAYLTGELEISPTEADAERPHPTAGEVDFRDLPRNSPARRALEIAAAGGHSVLLIGRPGSGKTMLARRIPSILPELSREEQLETTRVWSAAGLCIDRPIVGRPFRAPHHTVSEAGLAGGGSQIRPGEMSLAHNGVLFLDELPEFPHRLFDLLREARRERQIAIAKSSVVHRMPASFMLVASALPCPCGQLPRCACRPDDVARFQKRIPFDLFDMVVEVPTTRYEELLDYTGEDSATVRARVVAARSVLHPARAGESALVRVSRTIAALAGTTEVTTEHAEEAARYVRR